MRLPIDENRDSVPLTQRSVALAVTNDSTISASTTVNLNASTTLLEVFAKSQGIFMKYGSGTVTSTSFDEYISADATRHYLVPDGVTAVSFIEESASATLILIEK